MAAPERFADQLGDIGVGHIEQPHVPHPFLRQTGGQNFAGIFRMAVNRAAEDRHGLLLRRIAAPALIFFNEPADILPPDRAVKRAEIVNVQPCRLFQHILHRRAVFADNVGVVPAGIIQPVPFKIHLVGKNIAVHGAEGSKGICGEQDFIRCVIGHHDLRPVDQRRHDKGQLMLSKGQGIPLPHRLKAPLQLHREKLTNHPQRLSVADNNRLGMAPQRRAQRCRVIRLHVVHDDIVQFPALQCVFQIFKKAVRDGTVHRVQQGGLFIPEQIGVIGNAPGNRIDIFKKCQSAVRAAQPNQVGCNILCAVHIQYLHGFIKSVLADFPSVCLYSTRLSIKCLIFFYDDAKAASAWLPLHDSCRKNAPVK